MGRASATVTLDIYQAEDSDWTDTDEARDGIEEAVMGCINNACDVFRHSTSIGSIEVYEFEPGITVAEVRVRAEATVKVAYDNTVDLETWAYDNAMNILLDSSETEWEGGVVDSDTGDSADDAEYDAADGDVPNTVEILRTGRLAYMDESARHLRVLDRIRSRVEPAEWERLTTEEVKVDETAAQEAPSDS